MKIFTAIIVGLAVCCAGAPSFAAEPIKIGAFFALSGPAANIGTAFCAANWASARRYSTGITLRNLGR